LENAVIVPVTTEQRVPTRRPTSLEAGVTLVEMIIVVSIIALVAAISFPSVNSGLDSLRMTSASNGIVNFLNSALNRAERRRHPVAVSVSFADNTLVMRSAEPGFIRTFEMPDGVKLDKVHPFNPELDQLPRDFILYPAGAVPRFGIEIVNRRGARRIVRVDPTTGVPQTEILPNEPAQ
jgi:prepilin-type N-terminal cleavage/methylation domain-containing protein